MISITGLNADFGRVFVKNNNGNPVKVTINEWKGTLYIHIREYMIDGDTGREIPTSKGITIPPEHIDGLIHTLQQVSLYVANLYRDNMGQYEFNFNEEDNE